MKHLSLSGFTASLSALEKCDGGFIMTCDALEPARAVYKGSLEGFAQAKYLYADVESELAPHASPVVNFEFWSHENETDQPDMTIRLTCLPKIKTRLIVPLEALNAQKIFLKRTPGSFRGFVTGVKVEPSRLGRFAIGLREYWSEQRVCFSEVALTDEMPEVPVPDVPLIDELGQWMQREWEGKSTSVEQVVDRLQAQLDESKACAEFPERSRYGGYTGLRFEPSGFFTTAQKEGRHYLADPDGYAFLSTGIDGTSPRVECPVEVVRSFFSWLPPSNGAFEDAWYISRGGDQMVDFLRVNLIRAFGSKWLEAWAQITRGLFCRWGFNTLGNHSQLAQLPGQKIPYVHSLLGFPTTDRLIYRDFPDVFSRQYEASAQEYAAQLAPFAQDRYLIGYFMRNEPEWGFAEDLEIAAELLRHPDKELGCKQEFIRFMKERYGEIDALNAAWDVSLAEFSKLKEPMQPPETLAAKRDLNDFSYRMIREYIRVPALALREVDPNHLNLGMRYAFILYPNQCAGKEFMDVFSINCYKIDPSKVLSDVTNMVKMPVLIGEFHFGSIDKGLGSTGIIGVKTQKDRGLAYQRYLQACALNPYCVGAHWFTLYDQSCMGRFDGENYQIGLLDVCNSQYVEFIDGIINTHQLLYPLAAGLIAPQNPCPEPAKSNIAS